MARPGTVWQGGAGQDREAASRGEAWRALVGQAPQVIPGVFSFSSLTLAQVVFTTESGIGSVRSP